MSHTMHNGTIPEAMEEDPEIVAEMEYAEATDTVDGKEGGVPIEIHHQNPQCIKKTHKALPEVASPPKNGVVTVPRSQKNKRQPRSARGRGDAKKEGGGGKFTWGTPGKVYEDPAYLDRNDPNYDSDSQGNVTFEEFEPEMNEADFSKCAELTLLDFFQSGDMRQTLDALKELQMSPERRTTLIKMAITLACDRKSSMRELASELLSESVNRRVLWPADLARAFQIILNNDLTDLVVDLPSGAEIVGNFIARATADLALSTEVAEEWIHDKEKFSNSHATAALDQVEIMMAQRNRLHDIWGVGGGTKPVRFLARQMQILLQEYLGSQDAVEARRCLHELEVPHFHHELVFQAGVMAIEAMHSRVSGLLAELLKCLFDTGELTLDAVGTGFDRLFKTLPDLAIDVPPAYTLADRWTLACSQKGFLPANLMKSVPQRGRRRFVSEGDGGRLSVLEVAHPLI